MKDKLRIGDRVRLKDWHRGKQQTGIVRELTTKRMCVTWDGDESASRNRHNYKAGKLEKC